MDAVLARDGLERRECLEGGLAQAFVARDVMGGPGRFAVLAEVRGVDGDDLALEATLRPGGVGALLGLEPEPVAVLSVDSPFVGDAFGTLELGRVVEVL